MSPKSGKKPKREPRENFRIEGDATLVVDEIARRFIEEKRKSRSKAMDNLQSRLLANAVVLMEAGYIDFEKLLGKVGDLEKTTVQKEKSGFNSMDRLEAFMQDLSKSSVAESEPMMAPVVSGDDDDEEAPEDGEDEEPEEIEENASTSIEA